MAAKLLSMTGSVFARVGTSMRSHLHSFQAIAGTQPRAAVAWRSFHTGLASQSSRRVSEPKPATKMMDRDDTSTPTIIQRTVTKKRCPICSNKIEIDYKNVHMLSQFVTDHSGMILPRTLTGVCAKQQRKLAKAIKRSRAVGLMPYTYKLERYRGVLSVI